MNGDAIDSVRDVGLTSILKGYLSYKVGESLKLRNAGSYARETFIVDSGKFNVSIPLSMVIRFNDDYKKIILNMKQELVMIRNNNDYDPFKVLRYGVYFTTSKFIPNVDESNK